ncbi:hypothetical protein [Pectobacterium polaris]|uniref:hypothetical protein n=1 Tax=Pectobacterium polaris TaxID=2042057 RepID=UPI000F8F557F|nr:hypothetical protein [Pectobacterium polaris]RUR96868.1 hypothetical protein KHDHEBDM_02451 [Pectobacterium polaris]
MTLFDGDIRHRLEKLINIADMEVRQDFYNGFIVDENDYTSNLTSHIRRIINAALPLNFYTHSQKLPPSQERSWGADAMVVLIDHDTKLGKISFFEAKVDRANWDYLQKSSSLSHFSTQLDRQTHAIECGYAVWEQFYSKESIRTPSKGHRDPRGSSCIIHALAANLRQPLPNAIIWKDADVDSLCKTQTESSLPITMGEMIRMICECRYGTPYGISHILNFFNEKINVSDILVIEGSSRPSSELEENFADIISQKIDMNCHD